jgi:hypothetical protein
MGTFIPLEDSMWYQDANAAGWCSDSCDRAWDSTWHYLNAPGALFSKTASFPDVA